MGVQVIQIGDCALACELSGMGEPLLFAHGFGLDRHSMRGLAERLGAGYRAVSFDCRGHGETRSPEEDAAFSYPILRDDLLGLMDALSLGAAHVVGHSMGGQIALMAAIAAPERVRSLVTIAAGPCRKVSDWKEEAAWRRSAAFFEKAPREDRIKALAASAPIAEGARERLDPARLYGSARGPDLARMIRGAFLRVESNDDACAALRVPTLIIAGEKDAQWLEASRNLHRLIPGSRFSLIADAGHLPHMEQEERVAEIIGDFLDGLPRT